MTTDLMYFINSFKQGLILIMKDNRSFSFKICSFCKCITPLFPVLMGKIKTSKNFTVWFWEIYSLLACLPLLAEEIPPLLVNSRLGCFCYPMILLLWCVPLFSVKIPIALQSQSWVGPCCAKCFMDRCLKQLRKRGKETVVQKKSVLGLWMESRPIFWTNTVSMEGCWMPLCPSSLPTFHKRRLSSTTP